ncbi:MAG: sugar ABC transporter permease [Polyangia bacterium]|nr:sugar ABC transporter permease [Polyangia bacterium]
MRKRSRVRTVLIHAVLIAVTGVTLFPVALVVRKSLTPGNEFELSLNPIPPTVTLEHYERVLSARDFAGRWLFGRQLWNSFVVALLTTIMGVFLASTAAYAFSRFRFPGRRAGLTMFLVVQMFPATLIMIPLYVILDRLGLLDTVAGLVLVYSTTAIPFCVFMLKGYFDTIPRELEEAAWIDGCSRFGMFWRIVLPLSKPAIAVTALFSFMTAWNEYILAETFLNDELSQTLPVMLKHYVGDKSADWGSFAAGAFLVSLPVMALFYMLQRSLVSGLTAGGVKG